MSSGPEFATVESPFIDQLIGMGRKLVTDNLDQPSVTGRATPRKNLLTCRMQMTDLLPKGVV